MTDLSVTGKCITAPGAPMKNGYHRVTLGGKRMLAHRAAYVRDIGPIPEGGVVRHKCDNTHCWNSEHLETGTQADNARDMMDRRRRRYTLEPEEVPEVRDAAAEGLVTYGMIGEVYGITYHQVSAIARGLSWRNVA